MFRLFGCDHGCFHLEWKYLGIVHMTAGHLVSVHAQLTRLCKEQEEIERGNDRGLWLECNAEIQIRLTYEEAVALMAETGALLRAPHHLSKAIQVSYVM